MDRSVPLKAIEMLQLKNMACDVVRVSEEYEAHALFEPRPEEEENARRAAEVAATESFEEDGTLVPDEASREQTSDSEDEESKSEDGELLDPNAEELLDHELFEEGTLDNSMRTHKVRILKLATSVKVTRLLSSKQTIYCRRSRQ
jgi:actin-related protein